MAHIANGTSGVCQLEEAIGEEAICNAFAADFLMPRSEVLRVAKAVGSRNLVDDIALRFRVSRLAAAIRARNLDLIDADELEEHQIRGQDEWERGRAAAAASDGFPPQWILRTRDLGPMYIGAVVEALDREHLTFLDASYLLNTRVPTLERIIEEFQKRDRLQ